MGPENLGGNVWRLNSNKQVIGSNGTIEGPIIVRVQEFEVEGKTLSLVQLGADKVQVTGKFPGVVTKK